MTWEHISEPLSRVIKDIEERMARRKPLPILSDAGAYDFSNCKPGNIVRFQLDGSARLNLESASAIVSAIALAADRAGLNWDSHRDPARNEIRISFR